MTKIFRVGLDIDGVGFNFGDSCHRYLNYIGLGHLWKSGPTSKPFWDWYKEWGWTTQQFIDFCNAGVDAGFIFAGPVKEGYVEAAQELSDLGHRIIIATDRSFGKTPAVSQELTIDWLNEHGIWWDELMFTADKTKADCHFFIEDKLENYDALVKSGTKAYLLNRPWNEVEGGDARNRIDSISEYVEDIKQAASQGYYDLTMV